MNLKNYPMLNRYVQTETYSQGEYERRWALLQRIMKEKNCSALIVFSPIFEGYDQWIAGVRGLEYVVVSQEGDILGIRSVNMPEFRSDEINSRRLPLYPVHPRIRIAEHFDFEMLAGCLRKWGPRIASINAGKMSADFVDVLRQECNAVEWVDITLEAAVEKAVKSTEEIRSIRSANLAHEKAMGAMRYYLRQGRTFHEVSCDVAHVLGEQGAGNGLMHAFLINVGRQDEPSSLQAFTPYPGYRFAYGDRLMVLMETNGAGNHCTAVGRFFSIGEPSEDFRKATEACSEAQDFAASRMKPGVTLTEIVRDTRRFIESHGWETNEQCFMHSMGYHMYEQYAVDDITANVPLRENVFLHCHPVIRRHFPGTGRTELMHQLNPYLVGREGGVLMNRAPREIQIVE